MSNKLSEIEKREIAILYSEGKETYKSLAEMYDVSPYKIWVVLKDYGVRKKDLQNKTKEKDPHKSCKRRSTYSNSNTKYNDIKKDTCQNYDYRDINIDKNKYLEPEDDYEIKNIAAYIIPIIICSLIISAVFPSMLKKDIKVNTLELKTGKYVGESILKKANGYGRVFNNNGDKYIGKFKNNNLSGIGTFISGDNYEIVGSFNDNKAKGMCIYKDNYNESEIFIGYYIKGKKNGIGVNISGLDFNILNYKNNNIKDEIASGSFAYPESIHINDDSGFSMINHEGRVFISKLKDNEFDGFTLSFGNINNSQLLDITVDDYSRKKSVSQIIYNNTNDYSYINKKDVVNKQESVFYIGKLKKTRFDGLGIQYNNNENKQYTHIGYYDKGRLEGKIYTIDKDGGISIQKK